MCGIIGVISKNNRRVGKDVLAKYEIQKSRGREGFGYCAFDKKFIRVERSEDEQGIMRKLKHDNSPLVVFHHRFPTSTINVEECTHPIYVSNEELDFNYYVVHNGVLRNEDELKPKHEKLGYVYNTELHYSSKSSYKSHITGQEYKSEVKDSVEFNDSESLAIELARYLDGMTHKIDCVGTIAFICLQTTKEGKFVKLHYGHNSGNPLMIEEDKDNIYIKSVGGKAIEEDIIYTYTYKDDGTVEESQVSIDIGYTTEYNRTNGNKDHDYYKNNVQSRLPVVDYNTNRSMGFGLNNDDDWGDDVDKGFVDVSEYNIDTTNLSYQEQLANKVEEMLKDYCEYKSELEMLESDLALAQEMCLDTNDTHSAYLLENEITLYKEQARTITEKMNKIEEDYLYKIQGTKDFLDLVEDYEEEIEFINKEFDDVPDYARPEF